MNALMTAEKIRAAFERAYPGVLFHDLTWDLIAVEMVKEHRAFRSAGRRHSASAVITCRKVPAAQQENARRKLLDALRALLDG